MNHSEVLARPTFRLLIVPFGGPLKKAGAPLGVDLDGEWFSPKTDIGFRAGRHLYAELPTRFHHARDPLLGGTRLGTAVMDGKASEAGWWCTVTWARDEPAVGLIRALGARTPLFGSSTPLGTDTMVNRQTGEILVWPVSEVTISPSPQNIYARIEP